MTDTTPLHRLADKFRDDARHIYPESPAKVTTGGVTALARAATFRICADHLEAALAAIDVEAALNGLLLELTDIDNAGLDGSRWMLQRRDAIRSRLRSAFAAGQAQGIAKGTGVACPVCEGTGRVESVRPYDGPPTTPDSPSEDAVN